MVWEAMPGLTRRPGIPRTPMWTQGSAGFLSGPVGSDWPLRFLGSRLGSPGQPAGQSLPGRPDTAEPGAVDGRDQPSRQQDNGGEGNLERAGWCSWPLQPHSRTAGRAPEARQTPPPQGPRRAGPRARPAGEACGSQEEGALHGQRRRHDAAQVSPEPALACPPFFKSLPASSHAPRKESAHTPERLPTALCFSPHSSPPADHWAFASGLPTYVAESGFVSPPALPTGPCPSFACTEACQAGRPSPESALCLAASSETRVLIRFQICNIMNAPADDMSDQVSGSFINGMYCTLGKKMLWFRKMTELVFAA